MKQPVHVRTIRVEAIESGPGEVEVRGTLLDERPRGQVRWEGDDGARIIHDMTVTLRVHYPDFVITEARAEMAAYPYTICPEALPPVEQLVGLSVARGFVRAVQERFGRERGCSHLTALILAMAPVVKQGAGAAFRGERDAPTISGSSTPATRGAATARCTRSSSGATWRGSRPCPPAPRGARKTLGRRTKRCPRRGSNWHPAQKRARATRLASTISLDQ